MEVIANGFSYEECYRYSLDPEKDLTDYKIEQQASIIEDLYRITIEKILPRRARLNNNEDGLNLLDLYQAVLKQFLLDPGYARRN